MGHPVPVPGGRSQVTEVLVCCCMNVCVCVHVCDMWGPGKIWALGKNLTGPGLMVAVCPHGIQHVLT